MGRNRPRKTRPKATADSLPALRPYTQTDLRASYLGTIDYSSLFDNFSRVIICLVGIVLLGIYVYIWWWHIITRHPNWQSVLDTPSLLKKIKGLIRFSVDSFKGPLVVFMALYLFHPPYVIDFFHSLFYHNPRWIERPHHSFSETLMLVLPAFYYTSGFFLSGMFTLVLLYALHLLWAWSPQTGTLPLLLVYYGIKYYALALAVTGFGPLLFGGLVGYLLSLFLVFVSILDSNFRKELLVFHVLHPRTPLFFLLSTFLLHKRQLDLWVLWRQ